jgi:hypothetical protein
VLTTPEQAELHLHTCVYKPVRPVDLNELTKEIQSNIVPPSWDVVGGAGTIKPMSLGVLVVSQPRAIHDEIRRHYADLLVLIKPPTPKPSPAGDGRRTPQEALAQSTACEFVETPLEDVVEHFKEQHGIPMGIQKRALGEVGISVNVPITCTLKEVRFHTLLTLMLRDLDLSWTVTRTGLLVTTPEEAERNLQLVAYRAKELDNRGNYEELIGVISSTIAPVTWDSFGGPASIRGGIRGTLDVRQTCQVHQQIDYLLAALREATR